MKGIFMNMDKLKENFFAAADAITADYRKANSIEAFQSIQPKMGSMHIQILYSLKKIGQGSFTDIAESSNLEPSQVWKRLGELSKMEKIRPNGKKKGNSGRSVTVWECT